MGKGKLPRRTAHELSGKARCMTAWPLIRCPGCDVVVSPTQPACPGCGRCLGCGSRRAEKIEQCPKCDLPFCDCCGRCPECLELRYSGVSPCACGHPNDDSKLATLVRYNAVVGAEEPSTSCGCIVAMIVFGALVIISSIGLVVWLC